MIRGDRETTRKFAAFYLKDGKMIAADCVNRPMVGEASDIEKEMLEASSLMQPNSRLSCQVEVTADLDGLVVRIPAEQT